MGSNNYVRILTVQCELREGGFWVFTSKNLPGFLLSGKHYAALMEDVPRAVSALYRLNYGLNVDVRPAADSQSVCEPGAHPIHKWAAVPIHQTAA